MDIDLLIDECEKEAEGLFKTAEKIALFNQEKVLDAFRKNKIALRHFEATTGYGYDDIGRAGLCDLFKDIFRTEAAIVSPLFASGTHTIATALFGYLRPGDLMLSISGMPYDTLAPVIKGEKIGSLKDFGVDFKAVNLLNNDFDYEKIEQALRQSHSIVYIQRSRGYEYRNAFSTAQLKKVIKFVKERSAAPVFVDNCYGEFVDVCEPTEYGADVIMGSLIKNPGGGLAPTGGYIAGKSKYIEQIQGRYSAPGVGFEVGSYAAGYRNFYQGLFMAPHVTLQAKKSAIIFGMVFKKLGYEVLPQPQTNSGDIVLSIKFNSEQEVVSFCRAIQSMSPIDSHVVPYPWDMPGYEDKVIMAAGTFVQGASIELSADSPIRPPYVVYMQGALTYEHARIALKNCVKEILNK